MNILNIESINKEIAESIAVKTKIMENEILLSKVIEVAHKCIESLKNGGKIIFCGNGGSFADAQHLSAEFTSRFLFDRPALASVALGTNSSGMTAMGNDYGYENVFSRELEAIGKAEDVLIAITTSGNSPNILKAVEVAEIIGINTFILTGQTGGKLNSKANCLHVPSCDTARVQESHILIGHIVCGFVEKEMFAELAPTV